MKNTKGMDLTNGPIFKNLIVFSLPVIASSLLQQFYNTADQMVVGRFAGDTALAAVGSTGYITNLLLNLFTGLSVGATVTCAKYYGAKDKERIGRTVHTAISLALISGVFLAFVGILLARPLLNMMDTPSDVIDHSVIYMSIIFVGTPFSLVYNYGASLLRAAGDTKRPLYILSVSGILNVGMNLLFVIVFRMAEAGVALATILSQLVSASSIIVILTKRNDDLRLVIKNLHIYKDELLNIIRIGIPSGLNAILYNIANLTLQSSVNGFGKEYMAASAAASSITHYISLFQNAFTTATISFVGQNLGAKKYKRIHRVVMISLITSVAISTLIAVLIASYPRLFLALFTTKSSVIDKGVIKTVIMSLGYILNAPAGIFAAALRGLEKSKTPMTVNILSICVSRVAWIWFVFPLHPTFEMLFYCFPISWFLSSSALCIAYFVFRRDFPASLE